MGVWHEVEDLFSDVRVSDLLKLYDSFGKSNMEGVIHSVDSIQLGIVDKILKSVVYSISGIVDKLEGSLMDEYKEEIEKKVKDLFDRIVHNITVEDDIVKDIIVIELIVRLVTLLKHGEHSRQTGYCALLKLASKLDERGINVLDGKE